MENGKQNRADEVHNASSASSNSEQTLDAIAPVMTDSQVLSDMQVLNTLEEAKKKKHRRTTIVVVAVILVALLICAGVAGWYIWEMSQMTITEVV